MDLNKRNNSSKTKSRDNIQYCLQNYGASMVGISMCKKVSLKDPHKLFEIVHLTYTKILLKSILDGKCVNFTNTNRLWFNMVDSNDEICKFY